MLERQRSPDLVSKAKPFAQLMPSGVFFCFAFLIFGGKGSEVGI